MCRQALLANGKMHSDRIWTVYHTLHISYVYIRVHNEWPCIVEKSGLMEGSAICFQCIGDLVLKRSTYPVSVPKVYMNLSLTYEVTNAVR